jgi:YHS domain-containing protein
MTAAAWTLRGLGRIVCGASLLSAVATNALAVPAMKVEPICPVSRQPCDPKISQDFHGGRVWFCCQKCKQSFANDPAPYAAAAHQQMVLTRQFVQRACPLDGGPVAAGTRIDIGGVDVGFCCDACRSRAEKASDDDQVQLVFGNLGRGFISVKAAAPRR